MARRRPLERRLGEPLSDTMGRVGLVEQQAEMARATFRISPSVCPREGEPFAEGTCRGDQMVGRCRGLSFRALRSGLDLCEGTLRDFQVWLEENALLVTTVKA
jgi:hypothetical protein